MARPKMCVPDSLLPAFLLGLPRAEDLHVTAPADRPTTRPGQENHCEENHREGPSLPVIRQKLEHTTTTQRPAYQAETEPNNSPALDPQALRPPIFSPSTRPGKEMRGLTLTETLQSLARMQLPALSGKTKQNRSRVSATISVEVGHTGHGSSMPSSAGDQGASVSRKRKGGHKPYNNVRTKEGASRLTSLSAADPKADPAMSLRDKADKMRISLSSLKKLCRAAGLGRSMGREERANHGK